MERNVQKHGIINLVILLAVAIAALIVARYGHSLAGQMAAGFLGLGVLVTAVTCFQMRLHERERLEKLEFDEMTKSSSGTRLFQGEGAETFAARHSREQFERFFVPALGILLFLAEAVGAWMLWNWLGKYKVALVPERALITMSLLALFALVLFIFGKYSSSIARLEKQRLLRPSATYLLLGAYLLAASVVGIICFEGGFPAVDYYLGKAFAILLGLLALENSLTLILEIYRPRVKGQAGLLLYESRLVGVLSRPEGLFSTAAHAIDYQFGFKVSDTGFYQFLRQYLLVLVFAQILILVVSTSFVFIGAGEQALLEHFGSPSKNRAVLEPGFHLKWPWPIDRAYRYRTQEIQSFYVGFLHDEKDEDEKTVLWTVAHYKEEFNLLVASHDVATNAVNNQSGRKIPPVSLLSVGIPVQYQISDLKAWAYNHQDAGALLEKIGTREVVRYLVSIDLLELMSSGRFQAGEELRKRIQAQADELKLGAKILFVGLQDVHPPVKIAPAYELVVSASHQKKAAILRAETEAYQTNTAARTSAFTKQREAEAAAARISTSAAAYSSTFTNQMLAFQASPNVYPRRAYLDTLTRAGSRSRKIILATTNKQDVLMLNLEEKFRPDILDTPLIEPKAKKAE